MHSSPYFKKVEATLTVEKLLPLPIPRIRTEALQKVKQQATKAKMAGIRPIQLQVKTDENQIKGEIRDASPTTYSKDRTDSRPASPMPNNQSSTQTNQKVIEPGS
jgi:hypothetical protein